MLNSIYHPLAFDFDEERLRALLGPINLLPVDDCADFLDCEFNFDFEGDFFGREEFEAFFDYIRNPIVTALKTVGKVPYGVSQFWFVPEHVFFNVNDFPARFCHVDPIKVLHVAFGNPGALLEVYPGQFSTLSTRSLSGDIEDVVRGDNIEPFQVLNGQGTFLDSEVIHAMAINPDLLDGSGRLVLNVNYCDIS